MSAFDVGASLGTADSSTPVRARSETPEHIEAIALTDAQWRRLNDLLPKWRQVDQVPDCGYRVSIPEAPMLRKTRITFKLCGFDKWADVPEAFVVVAMFGREAQEEKEHSANAAAPQPVRTPEKSANTKESGEHK